MYNIYKRMLLKHVNLCNQHDQAAHDYDTPILLQLKCEQAKPTENHHSWPHD